MAPELKFVTGVLAFLLVCIVLGSLPACGSGVDYLPGQTSATTKPCVTDTECERRGGGGEMNQCIVTQLLELIDALAELAAAHHPNTQALREFECRRDEIGLEIRREMDRIEEDNK